MTCDDPGCTGVHDKFRYPYAEWCPAVKRRQHEWQTAGRTADRQRLSNRRSWRRRANARDLETLRRLSDNPQAG